VPVIGVGVATDFVPARTALLGFAALTLVGTLVVAAPAARLRGARRASRVAA
jgi:hypothetical protein